MQFYKNTNGKYEVKWFDPRNGGDLQNGNQKILEGGSVNELKGAPKEPAKDWVVVIKK